MAYTYKITTDEKNRIVVEIYENEQLVVYQPFNPQTLKEFSDEIEASNWAEEQIKLMEPEEDNKDSEDKQ